MNPSLTFCNSDVNKKYSIKQYVTFFVSSVQLQVVDLKVF